VKQTLQEVAEAIANDLCEASIIDAVMLREYDALCILHSVSEAAVWQKNIQ
jgi:hypothetical protein